MELSTTLFEWIRLLGVVSEAGRVLFSMTLDIVEAGEESVKGARRTSY